MTPLQNSTKKSSPLYTGSFRSAKFRYNANTFGRADIVVERSGLDSVLILGYPFQNSSCPNHSGTSI